MIKSDQRPDDIDSHAKIWGDDSYVTHFGIFEWGVSEDAHDNNESKVPHN